MQVNNLIYIFAEKFVVVVIFANRTSWQELIINRQCIVPAPSARFQAFENCPRSPSLLRRKGRRVFYLQCLYSFMTCGPRKLSGKPFPKPRGPRRPVQNPGFTGESQGELMRATLPPRPEASVHCRLHVHPIPAYSVATYVCHWFFSGFVRTVGPYF